MKKYQDLVNDCLKNVKEVFPWDLEEIIQNSPDILLLDIREPYEFEAMHIGTSLNVPRGILESACEYNYEETVPELVEAKDQEIVIICRSGNRSVLAAYTMQLMGYNNVASLKTGLKGWNDYELLLVDMNENPVDVDTGDDYFNAQIRDDQKSPRDR
jgi:rhodanese-related sulfurtransferase